jgi:hypothetical protein
MKKLFGLMLGWIIVVVIFWTVVFCVAVHFIHKFW